MSWRYDKQFNIVRGRQFPFFLQFLRYRTSTCSTYTAKCYTWSTCHTLPGSLFNFVWEKILVSISYLLLCQSILRYYFYQYLTPFIVFCFKCLHFSHSVLAVRGVVSFQLLMEYTFHVICGISYGLALQTLFIYLFILLLWGERRGKHFTQLISCVGCIPFL